MHKPPNSLNNDPLLAAILSIRTRWGLFLGEKSLKALLLFIDGLVFGSGLSNNDNSSKWYCEFESYAKEACMGSAFSGSLTEAILYKVQNDVKGFEYYYGLLDSFLNRLCVQPDQNIQHNFKPNEVRYIKLNKIGIRNLIGQFFLNHGAEFFDYQGDLNDDTFCYLIQWTPEENGLIAAMCERHNATEWKTLTETTGDTLPVQEEISGNCPFNVFYLGVNRDGSG